MDKLTPEQRTELAKLAATARWNSPKPATTLPNETNSLMTISPGGVATPRQGTLYVPLIWEKQ